MSDNKGVDASDSFFYSHKTDTEKLYQEALGVDSEKAVLIAGDKNLSLLEKLAELDLLINSQ